MGEGDTSEAGRPFVTTALALFLFLRVLIIQFLSFMFIHTQRLRLGKLFFTSYEYTTGMSRIRIDGSPKLHFAQF